jgi:molecular chaperone DnaK (HSP70)
LLAGKSDWAQKGDAFKHALRRTARKCKEALTDASAHMVDVPLDLAGALTLQHVQVTFDRGDLEGCIGPVLQRLQQPLRRLAKEYKLALHCDGVPPAVARSGTQHDSYAPPPRRVSQLVLVGGSTKAPAIRLLAERACGLQACSGVDPEQVVAIGAAIQAGLMEGTLSGGLEMTDSVYVQELQARTSGFQM